MKKLGIKEDIDESANLGDKASSLKNGKTRPRPQVTLMHIKNSSIKF